MKSKHLGSMLLATVVLTTAISASANTEPVSEIPVDNSSIVVDVSGGSTDTGTDTAVDTGTTSSANPVQEDTAADVSGTTPPVDTGSSAVDTGSVVDTGTTTVPTTDADGALASDGTNLPLAEEQVNAADVDTGSEITPVAPQEDTTVMVEKEPEVEPLPKTGIADHGILYGLLALVLGAGTFLFTRKKSVHN